MITYSENMVVTGPPVSNLPAELTSFIGRPRELSEGARLLADARLLTLTGAGGVGKTRLALRIAAERGRDFPDGVWSVDLAPLRDGGLLARTIAATWGLREESTQPALDTLTQYLRDKQLLLVLDNCEHLLDECAFLVSKLLTGTHDLRILATSRQTLNVNGEFVLPVPPMSTPDPDQLPSIAQVSSSEAIKMFADRAAASVPTFTITEENYVAVARLCHLLEGIPLALELAANWLRAVTVDQIVEDLGPFKTQQLLSRGFRTDDPRHQSLQAAMDWSYELCSPEEQTLWERLSVFSGGFFLEAVQEVCAGDGIDPEKIVFHVASLMDKSILTGEPRGPQTRYRMLETIRQYGHERLAKSGQLYMVEHLHLEYYLKASRKADEAFFGPRQSQWLDWLRVEFPNLRVALNRCVSNLDQVQTGLEIAAALHEYWLFEGVLGEGRLWHERALERADEQVDKPTVIQVKAQAVAATIALWQGDVAAAEPLVRKSSADAQKLGDPYTLARTLHLQGAAALFNGDPQRAIELLDQVRDRYGEDYGDPGDAFLLRLYRSIAACQADDHAISTSMACQALAERAGAEWSLGWALLIVGFAYWRGDDMANATDLLKQSLSLQRDLQDRWGPTWTAEVLAWTAAASGRHRHAAELLGATAALRKLIDIEIPGMLAEAHERYEQELREALGHEYETLYQQGEKMTAAEALAYALGERTDTATGPAAIPPSPLTRREQEVAKLIAEGKTNQQIADKLTIALRTAETHVQNILKKLRLTRREQIGDMMLAQPEHQERR